MSRWYVVSEQPADQEWVGFANRGYIRASEDPFDLNLTPEEIDLPPEDVQAAELDWTIDDDLDPSTWSEDSEPTNTDRWYLDPEPGLFYWDPLAGIDDFRGFYGVVREPGVFYWTVTNDLPVFYYTTEIEPQFYWSNLPLAASSFTEYTEQPSFYWVSVDLFPAD